jgi:hypothetical protein
MMMWQLDTLDCLGRFPPDEFQLYLKGGTCVQHYLPKEKQRFSMDLGFSARFRRSVEMSERLPISELYGLDVPGAKRMISSWASSHLDADGKPQPIEPPVKIVHAARKTVLRRSDMSAEALAQMMGLLHARGREGFNLKTSDWKRVCIDIAGFLESKILPLFT